jgi:hypothetical protein
MIGRRARKRDLFIPRDYLPARHFLSQRPPPHGSSHLRQQRLFQRLQKSFRVTTEHFGDRDFRTSPGNVTLSFPNRPVFNGFGKVITAYQVINKTSFAIPGEIKEIRISGHWRDRQCKLAIRRWSRQTFNRDVVKNHSVRKVIVIFHSQTSSHSFYSTAVYPFLLE